MMRMSTTRRNDAGLLAGLLVLGFSASGRAQDSPVVTAASAHDVSRPLRDIEPPTRWVEYPPPNGGGSTPSRVRPEQPDPVLQQGGSRVLALTPGRTLNGLDNAYVSTGFQVAIGASQLIQVAADNLVVFDKSGNRVLGPIPAATLVADMFGSDATIWVGNPIVTYDKLAGRWVFSLGVTDGNMKSYGMMAVSTTADATGQYYRYLWPDVEIPSPVFPGLFQTIGCGGDRIGVWSDGYYFTGGTEAGKAETLVSDATICAVDRVRMLAGESAMRQGFSLNFGERQQGLYYGDNAYPAILPADVEGTIPPPAGSPYYLLALAYGSGYVPTLELYRIYVDWDTPSNTRLLGGLGTNNEEVVSSLPALTPACDAYDDNVPPAACIPQKGGAGMPADARKLSGRLTYRRFPDGRESLLVSQSVATVRSGAGLRWYELTPTGLDRLSIVQSGTFSPANTSRWLGSIAMDKRGNIAVGYNASSESAYQSASYTGQAVGADSAGALSQAEQTLVSSAAPFAASQGQYPDPTTMNIDPSDDCTFWFAGGYLKAGGTKGTKIASFRFADCR